MRKEYSQLQLPETTNTSWPHAARWGRPCKDRGTTPHSHAEAQPTDEAGY